MEEVTAKYREQEEAYERIEEGVRDPAYSTGTRYNSSRYAFSSVGPKEFSSPVIRMFAGPRWYPWTIRG